MTYSIAIRCEKTGAVGLGCVSFVPNVGRLAPRIFRGGILAVQAKYSPELQHDIAVGLTSGLSPKEALGRALSSDTEATHRQVMILADGYEPLVFTGRDCEKHCGGAVRDNASVAGNLLASTEVLTRALDEASSSRGDRIEERILSSVVAGELAGGDVRGLGGATMLVVERDGVVRETDILKAIRRAAGREARSSWNARASGARPPLAHTAMAPPTEPTFGLNPMSAEHGGTQYLPLAQNGGWAHG